MLAGMMGNLYLMRMHHKTDSEIQARSSTMEQAMQHAARMIAQMLTFARKDAPEMSIIDLRPFFKETMKLAEGSLPESIRFNGMCEQDAPLMINGDATQLQQVIMNLVTNARHAVVDMAEGEIGLSIDAEASPTALLENYPWQLESDRWCRIICSDNGCGIRPEVLEHIFDPFFTTRAVGEGTGLGLAMVYGAVQNHHGMIDVES